MPLKKVSNHLSHFLKDRLVMDYLWQHNSGRGRTSCTENTLTGHTKVTSTTTQILET
jgi:hypothetical protein